MVSIMSWKMLGVTVKPDRSRLNLYGPFSVLLVNNSEHFSSICTWMFTSDRSSFEKTFPPFNLAKIYSGDVKEYLYGLRQSFKPVETSAQKLILWFFFFTYTVGAAHSKYSTFERPPKVTLIPCLLVPKLQTAHFF